MDNTDDVLMSANNVLSALAPGNEILLVEDNPGDADLILEMLSANGIETTVIQRAMRLSDGLKRLTKPSVRAVLLDLGLPDSTGLDTLRAVLAVRSDIAVIVLTGHDNEQLGLNAVVAGAMDYLVKGQITGPSLVRELRYAIERQRIKQQLRESEEFLRASMDALTAHIAILDPAGTILFVNKAWQEFAAANGIDPALVGEGDNYLEVCDVVTGNEAEMAKNFAEGIRAVLAGDQQSFEMEYPCHSPNEQRWFIGRVNAFPGKGPRNVSIAHENITARKLAEEALRYNTRLLRIAGKTAKIGGWQVDLENNQMYWSEEVARIHETPSGYKPPLKEGIAFYAPEWREKIAALFGACAREGIPYDEEMEIITAKGRRLWVRTLGEAERDESGRIVCVHGAFMDITEQKKSESEVARAAREWQRTFDGTNHAIWILDKNFRVLQANKVSEQLFPAFKGALIGKHCFEIVHGTDHNATECPVFNAQKSQERGQMDLQMGDRWFEITVDPILDEHGQFDGAVHIINDITERRQAEDAVRASEEKYRTLIETTDTGFLILDCQGRVLDANPEYVRLTGHSELREILGRCVTEWTAECEKERNDEAVAQCLRDGQTRGLVIDYVDSDGRITPVEVNATVQGKGESLHIVSLCRDVSERKQAETAVRESEAKFKSLFDRTKDALFLADARTGILIDVNPAACEMLGLPKESIIGMHQSCLHPPEEVEAYKDVFRQHALNGTGAAMDMIVQRADGTRIPVEITASTFELSGKPIVQGCFRDISERKQTEAALKQKYDELERFNRLTLDRELRMIALKGEVNALLKEAGQPPRYRENV